MNAWPNDSLETIGPPKSYLKQVLNDDKNTKTQGGLTEAQPKNLTQNYFAVRMLQGAQRAFLTHFPPLAPMFQVIYMVDGFGSHNFVLCQ